MSSPCRIPSNPDISGIGVRTAIYLQNLLCFGPAFWALSDGYVSKYELERAETQATTNLVLAFAILISCMVQARTLGLTNYHASIVLNMSWMNNTNAFIYFLLYVRHKSQPREGKGFVKPCWSAWMVHVWARSKCVLYLEDETDIAQLQTSSERDEERLSGDSDMSEEQKGKLPSGARKLALAARKPASAAKVLFRRFALLLGSLHLTLMATLGIWLWSDPRSFGTANSSSCATEYAYLAILGRSVRLGSYPLRIVSLVIYALFLVPGVNLLPPMVIFLAPYFCHHNRVLERRFRWAYSLRHLRSPVLAIRAGLIFLLVVNVIFIVDIELTLRRNYHLQGGEDEEEWRFGQILAMLLVSMPLRDLIETILARREKRIAKHDRLIRNYEVNNDLKKAIHRGACDTIMRLIQFEGADPNIATEDGRTALEVVTSAGNWDSVQALINRDVNPNTEFTGDRSGKGLPGTVLQAAARETHSHVVEFLLERGADPNLVGTSELGSALHAACQPGEEALRVVKLLLDSGADPNIRAGKHTTALIAACHCKALAVVETLLDHGADPNAQGNKMYGTALQAACTILSHDNPPFPDGWYPYTHAERLSHSPRLALGSGEGILPSTTRSDHPFRRSLSGDSDSFPLRILPVARPSPTQLNQDALPIVNLLIDRGADPNVRALTSRREDDTALHAACASRRPDLVLALLDNKANPDITGGTVNESPLHAACREGNIQVIQLLLERGADPNSYWGRSAHKGEFKAGVTPLDIHHSTWGESKQEIAQLLISCGARTAIGWNGA